jgi:hypothetical protein
MAQGDTGYINPRLDPPSPAGLRAQVVPSGQGKAIHGGMNCSDALIARTGGHRAALQPKAQTLMSRCIVRGNLESTGVDLWRPKPC